ncbi:integrase catalytic domain-containing protein [Trichonephila clavipes]|uniref:Integrase catalytic domain-containing protein n=1 Tax=Trichonephila clavipes TaxID=2585209 RepID=A0A8X6RD05_TRICX|nr:integrase catalytic domain-containing protein [Trichonephila clavipes]
MPGQIDILIGSELFFEILNPEQYYLQEGNVILQNTKFGYLVTGTLPQLQQQANCCLISEPSLDITVKKFFELESLPDDFKEITKSEEEIYCEEHFVSTYKRDKTGRFIVRLPIKENAETLLGYSKENAIKRLNGIWEKLNKNITMGTLYKEFMNEYELLGHMEEIKNETLDKINCYIPHHSVYKPEKTSTPLRVVFDASAKTTSGFSLNSILLNGGIIQQDLFSIVSRFRKHEYVFSADIKKMYRQILVDPNQRDLQRIMWKTSADAPVKTYKLATVTYGTVSAPFLATRTLKALADEEKAEFPDAADVICNDSYMDDILSRESTLEGANQLQTRLSQLLERGGFELHKWVSNSPELLKDLSASSYVFDKEFQDAPVKTLGMLCDPKVDCLTYKVKISDKVNFSKRDVLSEIARLYDPLGLIGPIVTKAKIFIQELWKIKLDWSEQLPPDAMKEWMNFYQKLSLEKRAYAAVVYIKCFNESGQSQTRLLCSKSRVAPLKTLTIPRLELSAALLLSRLVKKVVPILQLPIHKIWMWTDSTIALAWIKTEPHKLKPFVSNRVAKIQALSKDYHWKHVSSKNNPADLISRGCNVDELLKNEMWFSGPDLQTDEYEDNQLFPDPSYRDELKCAVTLSMTECSSNFCDELFNVTNNFIKLIRIFSFIFRFINNIKAKESCNKEKYLTAD